MKLGIVIHSNDPETAWNAFRLGVFARGKGDEVSMFLLGKGVECESIGTERFRVAEQMRSFVDAGGEVLACGTCLKMRGSEGSALCPVSTVADLHALIRDSDKLISV